MDARMSQANMITHRATSLLLSMFIILEGFACAPNLDSRNSRFESRPVDVPRDSWRSLDDKCCYYVIHTRTGREIQADRFRVTETGFLVETVIENFKRRNVTPFEVPFDDILSISQIENSDWSGVLFVVVIVAGVTLLIYALSQIEFNIFE